MARRLALAVACCLACLTGASAQALTLTGTAFAAGYLTGCTVSLSSTSGLAGTAVTDSAGRFSIPVTAASAGAPSPSAQDLSGAFLSLTANNRTCVDAATRLPLAVSLGALLPQYGDDVTAPTAAVHAATTLAYYVKRNVNAAQIRPYQAFIGGQDFKASGFYSVVGPLMGVPDASRFATEDLIAETTAGSSNALAGQALNVEVLSSLVTGSALLTGLKPSVTTDQAAEAMVVACFPAGASAIRSGRVFSLRRAADLAAIVNQAIGGAPEDVVDTGAASLAAMNQHIYELGQAAPSAAALGGLAQALAAGQADLAQAATQLATGAVAPGAWAGAYGPASLPAVYARAQVHSSGFMQGDGAASKPSAVAAAGR